MRAIDSDCFRKPLRVHAVFGVVVSVVLVLSGCSAAGMRDRAANRNSAMPITASPVVSAPSATTPSGKLPSAEPATPATDVKQSDVSSAIIETPAGALASDSGTEVTTPLTSDYVKAPEGVSTVLAAVVPKLTIYESATSNKVMTVLDNPLPSGAVLNLLVDGQTSSRFKVLLPIRPNGSTGWVDPGQVKKFAHSYRIVVEMTAHKITVFNGERVVLSEKIAVGKSDSPTPDGRYFLKELLRACLDEKQPNGSVKCVPNDKGIYGPYAYGLSGFSPVVKQWNGGEGVIGIHGTNQPELLGTDVSRGCIRMSNTGITALSKVLPLGTPVMVRA